MVSSTAAQLFLLCSRWHEACTGHLQQLFLRVPKTDRKSVHCHCRSGSRVCRDVSTVFRRQGVSTLCKPDNGTVDVDLFWTLLAKVSSLVREQIHVHAFVYENLWGNSHIFFMQVVSDLEVDSRAIPKHARGDPACHVVSSSRHNMGIMMQSGDDVINLRSGNQIS